MPEGTGTGCILLSLLKELYNSRGIGIDISSEAIKIAKANSKNLNLENRAKFKNFEIKNYTLGRYDLIVSNPPYIPSKDIKKLTNESKKIIIVSSGAIAIGCKKLNLSKRNLKL